MKVIQGDLPLVLQPPAQWGIDQVNVMCEAGDFLSKMGAEPDTAEFQAIGEEKFGKLYEGFAMYFLRKYANVDMLG